MERKIGIDVGYGFVKVTDGQDGYLFPSVVGDGDTSSLPSMLLQAPARVDDLRIVVDGKSYYAGNLAIRHSRLARRGLSATRVEGNTYKVLFLAALSLFCQQGQNDFALVTGLPPGRMHMADEPIRQIKGEHKILRPTKHGTEELVIRVNKVTVVPQPLGSYWSQVLDARGSVREDVRLLQGRNGIFDIGFRTTDLVTVQEGEYVPEHSLTIPIGLAAAYDELAAGLRAAHGIERETYALDEAVIRGEIHLAGKRVDITELREQAFENLATKLLVELQSAWQVPEYDAVLLSGGGGQALSRYLLTHLPQGMVPNDPGTANSRGFLAWANRTFAQQSDRQSTPV